MATESISWEGLVTYAGDFVKAAVIVAFVYIPFAYHLGWYPFDKHQ